MSNEVNKESLRAELKQLQEQGFRLAIICREAEISRTLMSLFINGKKNMGEENLIKVDNALTKILGGRR